MDKTTRHGTYVFSAFLVFILGVIAYSLITGNSHRYGGMLSCTSASELLQSVRTSYDKYKQWGISSIDVDQVAADYEKGVTAARKGDCSNINLNRYEPLMREMRANTANH